MTMATKARRRLSFFRRALACVFGRTNEQPFAVRDVLDELPGRHLTSRPFGIKGRKRITRIIGRKRPR